MEMEQESSSPAKINLQCVNCSISLKRLRVRSLKDASTDMLHILSSWIAPTPILPDNVLCRECFTLIEDKVQLDVKTIPEPAFGHSTVCFSCGQSILRARTHKVPLNCNERSVILRRTPLHQVSRLEKVCAKCWVAAKREVKRQTQCDANRVEFVKLEMNIEEGAVIPEGMLDATGIPEPVNHNETIPIVTKITSEVYRRASATSRSCMFAGCKGKERLLVPSIIKEMLLLQQKFYIPLSARVCKYHLISGNWNELNFKLNDFTGKQFDHMMTMMERAVNCQIDFSNVNTMPEHLTRYLLGMSAEEFYDLLNSVPRLADLVPDASLALSMYILKHRTGDSNERLALLFRTSRSTLERYMNTAKICLIDIDITKYINDR